jgi:Fe-S-cluster containining protein
MSPRRLPLLGLAATRVEEVYERVDDEVDARRRGTERRFGAGSIPCRAGCSGCCYRPALVFNAEVPVLVAAVRRLPEQQRREVELRARRWRRTVREAGIDTEPADEYPGYVALGVPCPLLDVGAGLCLIYEQRPLVCRGEMIVDRDGHGGSECRSPTARRLQVDVADIVVGAFARLTLDVAPAQLVPLLLPEMLLAAWPLVLGATTWERWLTEFLAEKRHRALTPDKLGARAYRPVVDALMARFAQ